ncbi:MAG: Mur ligase family protein, partial [Bryobacteraceae bacterium]
MKLGQLLEGVPLAAGLAKGAAEIDVRGLEYDSRRVEAGFVFFAFPGAKSDGRQFAAEAVAKGAVGVACESPQPEEVEAPWIQVRHGREALARMSRAFYGRPDETLKLTGVTGTNGKTTTVYLIDAMLRACGAKTGMAGTVLYHVAGEERPGANTTPESLDLMRLMAETRDKGGSHFNFEVSSHALALKRVFGLSFHSVVFTNLTRDHLDYHGTMDSYFEAKRLLFEGAGGAPPRAAVLNADDSWCARIRTRDQTRRLSYSVRSAAETPSAELRAMQVESGFKGVSFR